MNWGALSNTTRAGRWEPARDLNLNGAVSGAPSHLRDSIGRRGFPAASATFSPAATVSPRSIPHRYEFTRGALRRGFGPRPFIPGSDFRAILRISSVSRLQPGSYATHSDADAFHVRKHGAFDDRQAGKDSQEYGNGCRSYGN